MIPVQHQRMAFKYAIAFLTDEIQEVEIFLSKSYKTEVMETMLEKRLNELKNDLNILEKYELHD